MAETSGGHSLGALGCRPLLIYAPSPLIYMQGARHMDFYGFLIFLKHMIRARGSNWLQKRLDPGRNSELLFAIVFLILLSANQEAAPESRLARESWDSQSCLKPHWPIMPQDTLPIQPRGERRGVPLHPNVRLRCCRRGGC